VNCFDIEKIARQYAKLYREALGLKLKAYKLEAQSSKLKGKDEHRTSNLEC